ncbi:metal-dependent hydrolase [Halorientalis pallida]|uniref:Metal-dependent hydrolase n=1 Tax=Halorientalis pallida TaxID=2479928 RepID=A0A498L238_9EURY|nr:metal-dependent hydrolase [Halorientalis pallida]RXK48667.1 metal-dependent hydrolase [Halorientalis pallida]
MMLPTHALAGMALALPVIVVAPEFAPVALAAGFAGGVLPDLDMYVGHRRTLHYPVYFSALAVGALALALAVPTALTVGLAFCLLGAALHSVTDVFGGGLELRPWEGTSDRAVYDHYRGQWLAPRRWVGYDGSPGDLLLSSLLAVPLLVTVDGAFRLAVLGGLVVAVVYATVRRALPTLAERLVDEFGAVLPAVVLAQLPTRYQQGVGIEEQ